MKVINAFSTPLEQVAEFHKTAEQPVLKTPQIPSDKRVELRIRLLQEELREFIHAANHGDLVESLDALVDLQYIILGTVLEFGMGELFAEAFQEVHDSNMSKFCKDTMTARAAADGYTFSKDPKKKQEATFKLVGKNFVILNSYTNKILKGPHFFQPKLKAIIEKYLPKKENVQS